MVTSGPTPNEVLNDYMAATTVRYASVYHINPHDIDMRWVPQVGHIALKVMHVMRGTTPLQVIEEIPNSSLNVKQEKVNIVVGKAILAAFERIRDIRGLTDGESTEASEDTDPPKPKRKPGRPRASAKGARRERDGGNGGIRSDSRTKFVEDHPKPVEDDPDSDTSGEGDQISVAVEEGN